MNDSILFWNAVALEANRVSHTDSDKREQNGPTLSSRSLAMIHLAMYDAYSRVVNNAVNFPIYNTSVALPPAPNGNIAEAVAGAAYKTLSELYKAQKGYFDAQLSCIDQNDANFKFGMEVGKAMWKLREKDPGAGDNGYKSSMKRFRHRSDQDNPGQGFNSPFYGVRSNNFAVSERHSLDKPYTTAHKSEKYIAALRQVRAKGIKPELMATLPDSVGNSPAVNLFAQRRTTEQTVIGIYWGYDGASGLGTPPRLYNQIVRKVAESKNNSEGDNARLFAFVNAAMADAGILAWEQKYCHDLWRPVIGVREHNGEFGPMASQTDNKANFDDADPGWLPLGAPSTNSPSKKNFTPDFPAYPSGHATFGAAALHITRLFYGVPDGNREKDDLFKKLDFVSEEYNGGNRDNQGTVRPKHTRKFKDGLWQMIIENGLSRVYLGVHWVFDAFDLKVDRKGLVVEDVDISNLRIGGVGLGIRIAEDIFKTGGKKAPFLSTVAPNIAPPDAPIQPASGKDCAGVDKDEEKLEVQEKFPSGVSSR